MLTCDALITAAVTADAGDHHRHWKPVRQELENGGRGRRSDRKSDLCRIYYGEKSRTRPKQKKTVLRLCEHSQRDAISDSPLMKPQNERWSPRRSRSKGDWRKRNEYLASRPRRTPSQSGFARTGPFGDRIHRRTWKRARPMALCVSSGKVCRATHACVVFSISFSDAAPAWNNCTPWLPRFDSRITQCGIDIVRRVSTENVRKTLHNGI